MAIYRTPKTMRYTRIDNQLLHSNSLSPHAKLIMAVALSLMDNYEVNVKRLAKLSNMSQDSVRSALLELKDKGYVNRRRQRIDGKYGKMLYDFFEDPSLNPAFHTTPKPEKPNQAEPAPINAHNNINNKYIYYIDHKNQSLNQEKEGQIEAQIRQQIEYDCLCQTYDQRLLDDFVGVMAEAMTVQAETIQVRKGSAYPTSYIRSCLAKINALHIEQIMNKLEDTRPTISNTRGYLLIALINAANTMSMTYQYGDY